MAAADVAARLRLLGHTITHDWWNHEDSEISESRKAYCAGKDFTGVCQSQAFILLNFAKSEGKAVETGAALACHAFHGTPMMIGVGPRYTNIFQHMPEWTWFEDVDQMLAFVGPTLEKRVVDILG